MFALRWFHERLKNALNHSVEGLIGLGLLALVGLLVALLVKFRDHLSNHFALKWWIGVTIAIAVTVLGLVMVAAWWLAHRRADNAEFEVLEGHGYSDHVREILYSLHKVLHGTIPGVTPSDFIESGILAPARDLLMETQNEDVRLSVLVPDGTDFTMRFAAGHALESKARFRLPIKDSFSKWAFHEDRIYWSDDLENDDRFERHPRAAQERRYDSIISVPIHRGEEPVAVFNAIFTARNAFDPADLRYVRLLGAVIDLVWELFDLGDGK